MGLLLQWSAPEVLRQDRYGEKADVWSFGVVIWEMMAMQIPFAGENVIRIAAEVAFKKRRLPPPAR